jgi:hypothetical protein
MKPNGINQEKWMMGIMIKIVQDMIYVYVSFLTAG